jgi:hypothetical protein
MKDGNRCGRIDGDWWRRQISLGNAQESVERLLLIICLYPSAHIKGLAIADGPFKYHSVGNENLCAAIGENPAHFGKGELRIQRNRNASRADNGKKPMEAFPIVAAIDGNRLARAKRDGLTQKSIDGANFCVQIGKMKDAAFVYGDFAIPFPTNQLIHKISDRDSAVPRELIALDNTHCAETGLRPQSLATQ